MQKFKHYQDPTGFYRIEGDGGEWGGRTDAACVEQANLAPELLEALQGVVRVADRATDEFDAARAAIAKATGAANMKAPS